MADPTPHRAHLDRLPVGERPQVDPDRLMGWSIFPFELEGCVQRVGASRATGAAPQRRERAGRLQHLPGRRGTGDLGRRRLAAAAPVRARRGAGRDLTLR